MKKIINFFKELNIIQKIFLFLFLLNQPLYVLYKEQWIGHSSKSSEITIGGTRNPQLLPQYLSDEEMILWVGVSIVLLFSIFIFKSKRKN
tara:strand:- start:1624 stop:1893 length:270 start_codon:yes stop_codon:yes gene_type:complete